MWEISVNLTWKNFIFHKNRIKINIKLCIFIGQLLYSPKIRAKQKLFIQLSRLKLNFSIKLCCVLWCVHWTVWSVVDCFVSKSIKLVKAVGHSCTFCFHLCVFTNASSKCEVVNIYPKFPFSFCFPESLPVALWAEPLVWVISECQDLCDSFCQCRFFS